MNAIILQGVRPRAGVSKWSVGMSPSIPPHAPVPASCRVVLLSRYRREGVEGNYPGSLARAQPFAEHRTRDLIPEQSIDPVTA